MFLGLSSLPFSSPSTPRISATVQRAATSRSSLMTLQWLDVSAEVMSLSRGVDIVEDYKYLGVHNDNKLDWRTNTDALYRTLSIFEGG